MEQVPQLMVLIGVLCWIYYVMNNLCRVTEILHSQLGDLERQVAELELRLPTGAPEVLEEFDGYVIRIKEDEAIVEMHTSTGEVLEGTIPAEELQEEGIGVGDWIHCRTIKVGRHAVGFEIERLDHDYKGDHGDE